MDLEGLYAIAGTSDDELQAFVDRQNLTKEQQRAVTNGMIIIGHSFSSCARLGMDYLNPIFTPLARAYAHYEAGCR
ncbi:MAG: hypothetical protein ABIH82_04395 [Candidatus Woesearchaeota archaeon]